jgi:RNA polymerase sporulation-specific sigma factor
MTKEKPTKPDAEYQQILLTTEYRRTVERIARTQTKDTGISWEDAAQTAHIKVWQATVAGKFCQQGVKAFYHWAAKVAKNAIIDLVRKEKNQQWQSLYQNIPGTDMSLIDTIADEWDVQDALEFKDLLLRTIEAIKELDMLYPERGYFKLWTGLKQGKIQSQLAVDLGCDQSTISKRRQELCQRVAQKLGMLEVAQVKQKIRNNRQQQNTQRRRSDTKW